MHRVNWWAIVVSAIAFFLFGWLWYGVLFAHAWYMAIGKSEQQTTGGGASVSPFALSLVMAFFLSYGLARILSWRGEMTPLRGAFIGFSAGVLIFGTMTWMDYAFEMRPGSLLAINVGDVAIGMAIVGAILGAWKPKPN